MLNRLSRSKYYERCELDYEAEVRTRVQDTSIGERFNVKATHYTQNGTSTAQHKTQGKRKADRWKIDCERRREEHKTLLNFPCPKSLNYYWLLIFYFNIVRGLYRCLASRAY
jgi:hypothetical protein